jgi:hypothetical protein
LGSHPVAVVQYTFTHKRYTEQHKKQTIHRTTQNKQYTEQHKNNTQNNTKQTIHRTTQNKQYTEQHKKQTIHRTIQKTNNTQNNTKNKQYIEQLENIGSLGRAVPQLCGFYPGICLTTEEKSTVKPPSG